MGRAWVFQGSEGSCRVPHQGLSMNVKRRALRTRRWQHLVRRCSARAQPTPPPSPPRPLHHRTGILTWRACEPGNLHASARVLRIRRHGWATDAAAGFDAVVGARLVKRLGSVKQWGRREQQICTDHRIPCAPLHALDDASRRSLQPSSPSNPCPCLLALSPLHANRGQSGQPRSLPPLCCDSGHHLKSYGGLPPVRIPFGATVLCTEYRRGAALSPRPPARLPFQPRSVKARGSRWCQ